MSDPIVVTAIRRAWIDSQPANPSSRHEEGGYIVQNSDGSHHVDRWPKGQQAGIIPTRLDVNNFRDGCPVVAAFHTHPNPPVDEDGNVWDQGDVLTMLLQLTPVLSALDAARAAGGEAIHPEDEVTMDDQGDRWVFEFIPDADALGGGARVTVAKKDLHILSIVRGQ